MSLMTVGAERTPAVERLAQIVPDAVCLPDYASEPFVLFLIDDPGRMTLPDDELIAAYIDLMAADLPHDDLAALSPRLAWKVKRWWIGERWKCLGWLLIAATDQHARDGDVFPPLLRLWERIPPALS